MFNLSAIWDYLHRLLQWECVYIFKQTHGHTCFVSNPGTVWAADGTEGNARVTHCLSAIGPVSVK